MNVPEDKYWYMKGKLEVLSSWCYDTNKTMFSEIDMMLDILDNIEKENLPPCQK